MRPVHFEIHSAEPERAAEFYRAVFGWRVERWGEQPYWVVATGEGPGIDGGLMPRLGPPPADGGEPNAWVVTVDVDDLREALDRLTNAGGTVVVPISPIPGIGWLAYGADLDGNRFGLMQSDESAA
jgi:predicted enzyme related to lactoylglutathione lyase